MSRRARVSERRSAPSGHAELARARTILHTGPVADAVASFRIAHDLAGPDTHLALTAALGAAEAAWAAGDHTACRRQLDTATPPSPPPPGTDTPAPTGARTPDPTPPEDLSILADHLTGLRALLDGRTDHATAPLHRVITRGSTHHHPEPLHRAAVAALLVGDIRTACRVGARALAAARAHGDDDLVGRALEYLAYAEMRAGHHARARAHAVVGLRSAVITGQLNIAAHHRAVLALTASVENEPGEVAARASEALTVARRHGLAQTRTLAEWALARADLGAGRTESGAARLATLVSPGPDGGHFAIRPLLMPSFVEASVLTGHADAARPVVAEMTVWTGMRIDPAAHAQLARCRALLAAHDGADDEAEHLWNQALALHAQDADGFERAGTQLLFGKWLRRRRRPSDARRQLREALHAFERAGASGWAAQASGELRATGEPTRPPSSATDLVPRGEADPLVELTPHQQRIARYVADGATNREVARTLSISVRTVDHHLRNIFTALGVRSRVELTRRVTG